MSDEELKMLVASLAEGHEKIEAAHLRVEAAQRKTEATLNRVSKQLGGMGNSNGEYAEQYFYHTLKKIKALNGIHYDDVERNWKKSIKSVEGEYDIMLINDNTIAIVEVKYKIHLNDVVEFYNERLPKFKILFPMYENYTMYGAIAGFVLPDESIQKAKEYGLFVLTKTGKEIEILNNEVKVFS